MLIALLAVGCLDNTLIYEEPKVHEYLHTPSLNKIYPILLQEAQKLDSDAKLKVVVFDIVSDEKDKGRVVTAFFRVSGEHKKVFVEYYDNETIQSKQSQYRFPAQDFDPILYDDWGVDSKEALDIFFHNEEILAYDLEEFETIRLMLMRKNIDNEKYLIWKLSLIRDTEPSLVQFSIDANTGELLEVDIH